MKDTEKCCWLRKKNVGGSSAVPRVFFCVGSRTLTKVLENPSLDRQTDKSYGSI